MKKIIYSLFSLFLTISCSPGFAQIIKNKVTLDHLEMMFRKTQQLAEKRSINLFGVLNKEISTDEKLALKFLYAYMPLSDLADYNGDFFLANIRVSLKAKEEMPWGKKIPEDIFLHYVLPIRVNNENLDSFRILMYDELKQRVKGLSMKDAALEVNHWCHEKVTYRPSDDRTSAPMSTVRTSFGRCGEESTFTVSAMRMIGIPARQVYTPRWAHTDDNHAWVEVWINGKWFFLGACEPDPDLNMGWFAAPATRAMLIHSRVYGWYNGPEQVISSNDRFAELNLISNYANVKSFHVRITDSLGKTVDNAKVEYQLYNYAEFYPIAKTYTDSNGITGITTGLGDLLIWANKGNSYSYKKISVKNTDTVKIILLNNHPRDLTEDYDMVPPVGKEKTSASDNGRKENQKRLHLEDSVRTIYMSTFRDSIWAKKFAAKLKIDKDSIVKYITASYGNWKEISLFLLSEPLIKRNLALKMLSVITDKDLRDTKAFILKDHFDNAIYLNDGLINSDQDFFAKYVMSGRIGNEMMTNWRAYLQKLFSKDFAIQAKKNPLLIADWIRNSITIDNSNNAHSRAPLTPRGVYELRVADNHSRDIFFVALCRSMDIPARLNPETDIPQYWNGIEWSSVIFESTKQAKATNAFIHLINNSDNLMPKYTNHFTIGKLKDEVYRTLQYDEGKPLKDFPDLMIVETGKYMLVTGNRLNDGTVLCSTTYFELKENETKNLIVNIRQNAITEKPWAKLDLKPFELTNYSDKSKVDIASVSHGKGCVIIFIDPDKETTKHIMNDLVPVKNSFEKWNGGLIFVLSKEKTSRAFKPDNFKGLPSQSLFVWDADNKLFKAIENVKGEKLGDNLPVIIISDPSGNLTYYSSGYTIGIGDQLLKRLK